ncbi:MAG: polymerase gamma/tau subunit-like protein [Ferruginibacter sp.]|nr:polymerase gamma/tau subunit-like protein [Ferruginibacter sp.]
MQFEEVIGQRELKQQLVSMVQQNRLSHALLFLGREGSGALSLARAFAQYSVCEKVNGTFKPVVSTEISLFGDEPATASADEPGVYQDSCGECAACLKAAKLIHPDIHFSYPVIPRKSGDKPVSTDYITEWREFIQQHPYGNNFDWLQFIGAENKQGNISTHECADIIRKMSLKSFEAGYKILIMWMPEMLGKEGNKLLKLIEEPPPGSLFILVAENDALVLPTILSRTQLVKVPMLQPQEIEAALELREGIAINKAEQIAAVSEGNYHEALQQLAHAEDDWELLLRDWLNSILKTGPAAQVKWIDEVSKIGREKQKQFLKYFTHLLEHAIRTGILGQNGQETSATNDFATRLNRICDISQQEAIVHELDQAAYYIERNANAKMLFHALTIKLYHIISNKSVILVQ